MANTIALQAAVCWVVLHWAAYTPWHLVLRPVNYISQVLIKGQGNPSFLAEPLAPYVLVHHFITQKYSPAIVDLHKGLHEIPAITLWAYFCCLSSLSSSSVAINSPPHTHHSLCCKFTIIFSPIGHFCLSHFLLYAHIKAFPLPSLTDRSGCRTLPQLVCRIDSGWPPLCLLLLGGVSWLIGALQGKWIPQPVSDDQLHIYI